MKVSIITVAYNAAATIADTCASVAAQNGVEIEHIIIDGGSRDDTVAKAKATARAGSVILSEPDNGLYDAMNKGIALATGDLLGFLNADDYFCRTDAIALIVAAAAKNPGADAIGGGVAIVDANDLNRLRRAYSATHFAPWMLRFGHMPPHPGFYVRKTAFEKVGNFAAEMRVCADFDWMLRFFYDRQLQFAAIPATVVTMRDGGISNDGWASRRRLNRETVDALRRRGVRSNTALVWSKYLVKAGQLVARAQDWPAPSASRWPRTQ
jgi:glycosyltransferase involved in cell wall biosynthesis